MNNVNTMISNIDKLFDDIKGNVAKHGIEVDKYNMGQLVLIDKAIRKGLDLKPLINPNIPIKIMNHMVSCMIIENCVESLKEELQYAVVDNVL